MIQIPYSRQDINAADRAAVKRVLASDFLTQGPEVDRFEAEFAAAHDVAHGVAVCNATAGLHLACLALSVGPGSLVWTSPNSFVASANCALYCGADVDFVDIDPATRNMSVTALAAKLERARRLPDVVIPVDFAGLPCDLREIRELADRYGFHIIQDASHATGAFYEGRRIGGQFSDLAVFSFHPVKILTTGEGGMVTTNDAALAKRVASLRSHGITRDRGMLSRGADEPWYYEQHELGFNYRLTDIQAALGRAQLLRLDAMAALRAEIAERYDRLLTELPLRLPPAPVDRTTARHLYVVEIEAGHGDRGNVFRAMRAAQIGVNVHYIPIHLQPYYTARGFGRGDFPIAEHYYDHALSLPLFPKLTEADQYRVVETLRGCLS